MEKFHCGEDLSGGRCYLLIVHAINFFYCELVAIVIYNCKICELLFDHEHFTIFLVLNGSIFTIISYNLLNHLSAIICIFDGKFHLSFLLNPLESYPCRSFATQAPLAPGNDLFTTDAQISKNSKFLQKWMPLNKGLKIIVSINRSVVSL